MDLYGITIMRSVPWALREGLILRRMDRLNSQDSMAMVDPKTLTSIAKE